MAEQAQIRSNMLGRDPGVEASIGQAVARVEALTREAPNDPGVLEALALIYDRAARAYTNTGGKRTPESVRISIEFNRKGLAAIERILAGQPEDERWLKARAAALVDLAKTLSHADEHAEADRTIGKALEQNAWLYARDPNNVELAIERLIALENASTIAYRVGDMQRTLRFARETIAQGGRIPEAIRNTVSMRSHLSEAKALMGGALLAMANAPSLDREKRLAMLTEARSLLVGHIAFLDGVRRDKLGVFAEEAINEVHDAIKACDEAIAKLSRG